MPTLRVHWVQSCRRSPYVYGDPNWKDKLTGYNGQIITYDAIGNPLNDGTWMYTWSACRQLRQMRKPGMTVQFQYDHNGLRAQKIVTENGLTTTTDYTLHGKLVTHLICGSDCLHFFYDAQSRPAFVEYNGTMYRYVHSLQGDIVGIVDGSGALVVEYRYDAWGNVLNIAGSKADELGRLNIFGYRGYEWDIESALYYLKSRYYNPIFSRFITSDACIIQAIFKCNVYNYGLNAPIIMTDICGMEATYTVVLNVYGEDYLPGTGHYDISIISETGQNCVFSFEGKTYNTNSSGMTLSFGGMETENIEVNGVKIQTSSRVDIFTDPERNLSEVRERFVLIEGLTQTSLNRFMNWFGTAYAVPGNYDGSKGKIRCKVWATGHTTYSSQEGPYCGSEAMFLVGVLIASTYKTRARVSPGTKSIISYLRSGIRVVSQSLAIIRGTLKAYQN